MAKKLENIFNECLERILQGESVESCLESYPKEAAQLEPLLRTALGFSWRASSLQPRPEFKARARVRLEEAQVHAKQQRQPYRPRFFAWQRSWAFALTVVLVILFAGAGTAAASSDALPDEPLYPVKLATEQTRLAFTFSDAGKVKLHAQLAENRTLEIAAMAREGKTEQVVMVTERLAEHLEEASYAIQKVEKTEVEAPRFMPTPEEAATVPEPEEAEAEKAEPPPEAAVGGDAEELKKFVEESASKNLVALEEALEQAPEQARPALRRAIKIISEKSHKKTQQEPGAEAEDEDKGKGKNEDKGRDRHEDGEDENEAKPTPAKPNQNQPSSQKNKNKNNSKK